MDHYETMREKIQSGGGACPVRYALAMIGQKWKIPILWHLADEDRVLRYSELKRGLPGITDVMLSKCLNELEQNNLIVRYQYDCIPPKVEYFLSERGKPLIPVLYSIHEWGQTQMDLDIGEAGRQS